MNTENNYDIDVMNGDVGKILHKKYNKEEKKYHLDILFEIGEIGFSNFPEPFEGDTINLELSYCKTVNKSQGSEDDKVLYVLTGSNQQFVTKKHIYTAVTRAKKDCMILMDNNFNIVEAINRNEHIFTRLIYKINTFSE
jgi:exodeoxyribonuclease V alpha subunit